jgi:hypothetical protein
MWWSRWLSRMMGLLGLLAAGLGWLLVFCLAHKESYIHISLRMNSSRRLRSQSLEE